MSTIKHLINHIRRYGSHHEPLYIMSTMVLFWAIFDGIITFVTPLIITQNGFSKTTMGLIIGLSSVAGAFFDFLMCRIFKNARHRRIVMIVFAICFIYPLILWQAKSILVYVIAMVIWGFYYDLHSISNFEFVGKQMDKEEHSSSFGVIHVFQSLGYLLAPIFAGLVVGDIVDWKPFAMAWVFLSISFIFFLAQMISGKRERQGDLAIGENCRPINFLLEASLWHRIGRLIVPVLLLTALLNLVRMFFWTAGPLFAESFTSYRQFAGFFMVAFTLPPLLVGWLVGTITQKHGKKKTAFVSFLLGSLVLSLFFLTRSELSAILLVFLASFFISFAWPAVNGAYADYISEAKNFSKEIEGLERFFANIGNVIGPVAAGLLFDLVGSRGAFSYLGLFGAVAAFLLLKITPKNIRISKATETPSHFAVINEMEAEQK